MNKRVLSPQHSKKQSKPHVPSMTLLALSLMVIGQAAAQSGVLTGQQESTLPVVRVDGQSDNEARESYQVTTTRIGKGKQELRDVPQSVTVVTERLIVDRNLDTLKETLHNTAGISFLAAEGGEEDIRLRGFSLQATGDIFVDGMRDPAFYERDTFNYDRLEVLRGSASMLFGRGSTGGVVNQVNKEPFLMNRNEITTTIGTGQYARVEGDFNLRTGENAALRVTTMATRADNHGAGINKEGIAPSLRFGIGTANEFLLSFYHLENDNGINYGLPWLAPRNGSTERILMPVSPRNYYGLASDVNSGSASYATAGHIHRFQDGGELKTVFRSGRFARDQRASAIRLCTRTVNATTGAINNPDCPSVVNAETISDNTVLTRGTNNKIMDLETRLLQSDYTGKFGWFGLNHAVLAGVDLADDDFNGYAPNQMADGVSITKPRTTLGTPNDGAAVDEGLRLKIRNRDFSATAAGVYMQDTVQIMPDWKLVAGLRWDRFAGTYRSYATSGISAGTITAERSRSDALWSKRLGILYQPTPLASFHASYGTSFNTSGDTYQYDALGSNTPPEGSRNLEIGARLDAESGNLSTRLALFHATKYNERNRDEESVSPTNYVLSGERHAAGFEIDVAGRIGHAWEIYASYAWIPVARIDKGASNGSTLLQGEMVGARPGLTPKHSATLWTTYKIDADWRIGGGINARSAMTPLQVTAFKAPAYATLDLMAEYRLQKDLLLKLNVTNVTDKLYADNIYRGHYVPGAPRTLQLSANFRF